MKKIQQVYTLRMTIVLLFCSVFLVGCAESELLNGPSVSRSREVQIISDQYHVPEDKQLILYTSHKESVYLPIVREFENRTGIWVEIHAGGTTQLLDEVRTASEEGACDVMFGGGIASYEAENDLFMPYTTRESSSIDPRWISKDGTWTAFTELPIVFVYNNKLLSGEEAPKGWTDLMENPEYKGRIAFADPLNSGTGYTVLATLLQLTGEDKKELIGRFVRQLDGRILSSSGDVIPNVSNGQFLVGITLEETAFRYMSEDNDISICYPEEGTSAIPDGCAMVKGAPHSYNAGLFIDFVTGADTQRYAVEQYGRRSVRTDIGNGDNFKEISIIDLDIKSAAREEKEILDIWKSQTAEAEE